MQVEELLNKCLNLEQRYTAAKAIIEERQRRLKTLEEECKKKGINPATIDTEIKKVETQRDKIAKELEAKLTELEDEIKNYEQ
jgi:uncharacterized protein Yka (UPF0111/DUF47 family)